MSDDTAPELLKMWLDRAYVQLHPIEKRKTFLWWAFLASFLFAASTFINSSTKYETLRAIGELGYGLLVLSPIVTGIMLVRDHLYTRKTWKEIMVLHHRLESVGMYYTPSYGEGDSQIRPIRSPKT